MHIRLLRLFFPTESYNQKSLEKATANSLLEKRIIKQALSNVAALIFLIASKDWGWRSLKNQTMLFANSVLVRLPEVFRAYLYLLTMNMSISPYYEAVE